MGGGEVLLVSCYELGHQPQGLASPLGFLARAGIAARGHDLAVEPLDDAAIAGARFVGVSVPMHTALRLGARFAARVRRLNRSAHLCFYGLYAPLNEAYLRGLGADSILGGECEAELAALVARVLADDPRPASRVVLERIDFAPPARDGLPPLDRYAKLVDGGETHLAAYTEASRGCLHLCRHCPIPPIYGGAGRGRFFVVPRELVLDDLGRQIAQGARHVTFGDPDFWNAPRHARELWRGLHERHPGVTFDATIKVEHLLAHAELLPEMAAAGCRFVVSAIESIDDRVLAILDKGHTRADAERAIALTRAAGIALRPSLVPFTPWTTLAGYLELIEWIAGQDLAAATDPVQLSIRLLLPAGSLLLERPEMKPHAGALDPAALSVRWTHPDPRMDALQKRVYQIVEQAAEAGEPPEQTLAAIEAEARRAAGMTAVARTVPPPGKRPARLTEAWFC